MRSNVQYIPYSIEMDEYVVALRVPGMKNENLTMAAIF